VERVLERVYQEVAGAGDQATRDAAMQAARDFFRSTGAWSRVYDTVLVPAQRSYAYTLTAGEAPHEVLHAELSGRRFRPLGARAAAAPYSRHFTWTRLDGGFEVTLSESASTETGPLAFRMALYPLTLAAVPPELSEQFDDALVFGALTTLYRQAGRPYTNLLLAAETMREYRRLRGKAVLATMTGNTAYRHLHALQRFTVPPTGVL
jgi:hypothetical protein